MNLLVNGESVKLPDDANIKDLIEHLGCQDQRIALEVNETIIPKSTHEESVNVEVRLESGVQQQFNVAPFKEIPQEWFV